MEEEELEKLGKESLVKIINGGLIAIDHLIAKQQESVKLIKKPRSKLLGFFILL